LTYRRANTRYSQKDVALLLGHTTACQVARWETGIQLPNLVNALMVGQIMHVPVEELFGGLVAALKAEIALREAQLRRRNAGRMNTPSRSST
jgi:transcriptional regulator with XRE-family HTH domain